MVMRGRAKERPHVSPHAAFPSAQPKEEITIALCRLPIALNHCPERLFISTSSLVQKEELAPAD